MRLRYYRRFRILPGVTMNVGKRGVNSFSFGRRGMHYTVGRTKQRVTLGIPGSGLFLTEETPLRRRATGSSPGATIFVIGIIVVALALLLSGGKFWQ